MTLTQGWRTAASKLRLHSLASIQLNTHRATLSSEFVADMWLESEVQPLAACRRWCNIITVLSGSEVETLYRRHSKLRYSHLDYPNWSIFRHLLRLSLIYRFISSQFYILHQHFMEYFKLILILPIKFEHLLRYSSMLWPIFKRLTFFSRQYSNM